MAYMFRQKLRLQDLAGIKVAPKKVMIFEPDEYLSALYGRYLSLHEFEVRHCRDLENLSLGLTEFLPHLMVFNAETGPDFLRHKLWLKDCKNKYPELLIITTAFNAGSQHVSELMSAGVLSHINRNFSKPHDLVYVVKALLNN